MRRSILSIALFALAACGGSATDVGPTRYNFAVVDGRNQTSAAGDATLTNRITSQLTRDPQGKFAVLDFLLPTKAYAQGISLAGEPVAGAIVCGRVAPIGEPQVVPLCAFTLADGKAANVVQPGTKAGTYNILFTAQVPSQEPVKDSTTVVVEAGPMAGTIFLRGRSWGCWTIFPDIGVVDQYGNAVPYRFVTTGPLAHVASGVIGAPDARTLVADRLGGQPTGTFRGETQAVDVEVASGVIASGQLFVRTAGCVDLEF